MAKSRFTPVHPHIWVNVGHASVYVTSRYVVDCSLDKRGRRETVLQTGGGPETAPSKVDCTDVSRAASLLLFI